jgi:hypothetical protein
LNVKTHEVIRSNANASPRSVPSPLPVVVFALAFLLLRCGDLRQDEIQCEEAAAHLKNCCPSFNASRVNCKYVEGCDGSTHPPLLSVETSQCIRATSCDSVVANNMCAHPEDAVKVCP